MVPTDWMSVKQRASNPLWEQQQLFLKRYDETRPLWHWVLQSKTTNKSRHPNINLCTTHIRQWQLFFFFFSVSTRRRNHRWLLCKYERQSNCPGRFTGESFFFFNSCQRNNTDDFTVTECDVTSSSLHKIACLSLWIFAVQVKFTLTSRTVNLCFSSLRMGTSMFFFFFFPRIETLYKCQMSSVR